VPSRESCAGFKRFSRVVFLSLSTRCTEIRPEASFKGSGKPRAVAGRESVVPVPCFMAGHQIPDLLGVEAAWDARLFLAGPSHQLAWLLREFLGDS